MGFQKDTEPKYELLEENKPYSATVLQNRVNIIWVLFCIMCLVFSVVTLIPYITSNGFADIFSDSKLIELDFVIFGPQKVVRADYNIMKYRAEQYALSSYNAMNSTRWNSDSAEKTLKLDQEFKYVDKNYKLVCYYSLPKNVTTGQLLPINIDPFLCTHINLAFAYVNNSVIYTESETDFKVYEQVMELKKKNPALKILISIISNKLIGTDLSRVIQTPSTRNSFILNVIQFLEKYGFDGIDFDWEFPSWPDENKDEREKFMNLLLDLRSTFQKTTRKNGASYLLSAAVAAPGLIIDQSYDVKKLAIALDYINLMAYDYHFYADYLPMTGANAPLFSSRTDEYYFATLNGNWSINKWISDGMPSEKIVFGMPTYAHTFSLINPSNHGFNSPANGFGNSIGYDGFASYSEVCRFLADPDSRMVFDHDSRTPYAFKDKDWISFDNELSLGYKTAYVNELGLGGAMVWALNVDDYDGLCNDGSVTFPLIRQIKKTLYDDNL